MSSLVVIQGVVFFKLAKKQRKYIKSVIVFRPSSFFLRLTFSIVRPTQIFGIFKKKKKKKK